MFPVVNNSQEPVGCITTKEVKEVPRSEWAQRSVQAAMRPFSSEDAVSPDTDAVKALTLMRKSQNSRLMVIENGRLVAVLTLKDLLNFLSTKLEIEGGSSQRPSMFRT